MRAEIQNTVAEIEKSLELLAQRMDYDTAPHRLEEFNARVEDPDLWNDPDKAQKLMRDRQSLVDSMAVHDGIRQELTDHVELIELGEMEEDDEVVSEAEDALKLLAEKAAQKELEALLDGEADSNDTFLEINAGAGGTEACDWAQMLQRMYVRWAEKRGYKVELQSEEAGAEAGIKSCAYKISGHNAYGWLKSESGVHRLVRISPYDSSARRHTSFSSVWVYPVIDDDIDIEINPSDLKIDTYRASGAGGQHVNTTDSAVRITHQPTGIVVASQNDRSQHKNRATAMNMLKARLFEREMAEREAAASGEYQEKSDIGWGHQIRSYVLQPYQMVKDLRTGVQSPTPDDVLDGALDPFISAALAQRVTGETVEVEDED